MAGLGIQLAFFGFFIIVAGIFHFKITREPTPIATSMGNAAGSKPSERSWPAALWTLYVVSLLIFIRSIFRLIECARGNDGYLISHELFLYIFDALLMLGYSSFSSSFILPRSLQARKVTVKDALS